MRRTPLLSLVLALLVLLLSIPSLPMKTHQATKAGGPGQQEESNDHRSNDTANGSENGSNDINHGENG